jgi:hypothetical protein
VRRTEWRRSLGSLREKLWPDQALAAALDTQRREALQRDFIAYHDGFGSELGIAMVRDYR